VLIPIGDFKVYDKETLYRGARKIDWDRFLGLKQTFAIDFSVNHREFNNTLFAAQVLKDAICDHFRDKTGERPSVNVQNPSVQFHLLIQRDTAVISLDTSLTPLHKRGYRLEAGVAPLQETLAAALLRLAKYKADDILLDPVMGAGTLLVEAALIATNTPPGFLRQRWGFSTHPDFREKDWVDVKEEADSKIVPLPPGKISGTDLSKNMVRIAQTNLKAAGFGRSVKVEMADFREYTPAIAPNIIIANPPYGERMGETESLRSLYRELGQFMKKVSARPGKGFIISNSMELLKEVGLKSTQRHVVTHGGEEARFLEFDF
jgi:putative N6-adenine-specific DNA methylase